MSLKPVLFVEDNQQDCFLMGQAFAGALIRNELIFVRDAGEAMRCLGSNTDPGVIIMEVKLPGTSGPRLLERIRAEERWNAVPLVMLTNSKEDRDSDRILTPGADEYLVKPPDEKKIRQLATDLKEKFWSAGPVPNQEYLVFD